MVEGSSLINVGELTKPATVLIEKISDALGGVFRPRQIVRVARAEAAAELIRAEADVKISEIQQRAVRRLVQEETKRQENIENVTRLALPLLNPAADASQIPDDWIVNFLDKCRLASDKDLQQLWSRILAGEANAPGSFSRRTVNALTSFDRSDAEYFTALCRACWLLGDADDSVVPIVFDVSAAVYNAIGISFSSVTHLESIGLLQFETVAGFRQLRLAQRKTISYFGKHVTLCLPREGDNELEIGRVLLTRMGIELAPICGATPDEDLFEYVVAHWNTKGYRPACALSAG